MLKDETLFILGAGASYPYGYPLGTKLISDIIDNINNDKIYLPMSPEAVQKYLSNANSTIQINFSLEEIFADFNKISNCDFNQPSKKVLDKLHSFDGNTYTQAKLDKLTELANLRDALIQYDPVSIDAFLNHHRQYADAGKIMIIYSLLKSENPDFFARKVKNSDGSNPDNWYSYLINDILSGCNNADEIENNKVKIITFNYDMSLDYCLQKKLSNVQLLRDNAKAQNFVKQLAEENIYHVYGKIHEKIPIDSYGKYSASNNSLKCSNDHSKNMLRFLKAIASKNLIRLINEERPQSGKLNDLVVNAKRIIIIGFGFDRDNLNMLGFPENRRQYLSFLLRKQLKYMDYEGRMKGLAEQFDSIKAAVSQHNLDIHISRSTATSIIDAYQNDFKIYLYQ